MDAIQRPAAGRAPQKAASPAAAAATPPAADGAMSAAHKALLGHIDQFLALRCASDLLDMALFPGMSGKADSVLFIVAAAWNGLFPGRAISRVQQYHTN
jgi:hypothetical protein